MTCGRRAGIGNGHTWGVGVANKVQGLDQDGDLTS